MADNKGFAGLDDIKIVNDQLPAADPDHKGFAGLSDVQIVNDQPPTALPDNKGFAGLGDVQIVNDQPPTALPDDGEHEAVRPGKTPECCEALPEPMAPPPVSRPARQPLRPSAGKSKAAERNGSLPGRPVKGRRKRYLSYLMGILLAGFCAWGGYNYLANHHVNAPQPQKFFRSATKFIKDKLPNQNKKPAPTQSKKERQREFVSWAAQNLRQDIPRAIRADGMADDEEVSRALAGKMMIWDLSAGKQSGLTELLNKNIRWEENGSSLTVAVITGYSDEKVCTYTSDKTEKIIDGYRRTARMTLLAYPGGKVIGHAEVRGDEPPSDVSMNHVPKAIYGEIENNIILWADKFPLNLKYHR